ncbi:DUF6234 family protein [Streptomyces sp. NPDC002920]
MSYALTGRIPVGSDLAYGLALFVVEAGVFLRGLWGRADRDPDATRRELDAALRADLGWTEVSLCVVVVLAVLAVLARARWTAALQLLAAGLILVVLVSSQHDYDRAHPDPVRPGPGYSPCLSGSGECH